MLNKNQEGGVVKIYNPHKAIVAARNDALNWLNNSRRLSKDYDISIAYAEALVSISHFHTLLKYL